LLTARCRRALSSWHKAYPSSVGKIRSALQTCCHTWIAADRAWETRCYSSRMRLRAFSSAALQTSTAAGARTDVDRPGHCHIHRVHVPAGAFAPLRHRVWHAHNPRVRGAAGVVLNVAAEGLIVNVVFWRAAVGRDASGAPSGNKLAASQPYEETTVSSANSNGTRRLRKRAVRMSGQLCGRLGRRGRARRTWHAHRRRIKADLEDLALREASRCRRQRCAHEHAHACEAREPSRVPTRSRHPQAAGKLRTKCCVTHPGIWKRASSRARSCGASLARGGAVLDEVRAPA
jgi:hypothetical protein